MLSEFFDHGSVRKSLEQDIDDAFKVVSDTIELRVDLEELFQKLEEEGIAKFSDSFKSLLETISMKQHEEPGRSVVN